MINETHLNHVRVIGAPLHQCGGPGHDSLLSGQEVRGPVNTCRAGLAGGDRGPLLSAALQVITDVAVVLSHDDRPHLLPEAREVVLAVLRLRVAGTQLGQQDVSLVHQVVLAGQPVPQGGAALATLLAGPVSLAQHWEEERQEKVFSLFGLTLAYLHWQRSERQIIVKTLSW